MPLIPAITTVFGKRGTTKSTFSLSYPKKVSVHDVEYGIERAYGYPALRDEGVVITHQYALPPKDLTKQYDDELKGFKELWGQFTTQYYKDLADKGILTIVWDTGSLIYKLCCDAFLQELQEQGKQNNKTRVQLTQLEYRDPYRRMNQLYNAAKAARKDLVVLHHEADEYKRQVDPMGRPVMDKKTGEQASFATGNKIPEGWNKTENLSDWILRTEKVEEGDEHDFPYKFIIEKSAYGFDLVDTVIEGEASYEKLDRMMEQYLNGGLK